MAARGHIAGTVTALALAGCSLLTSFADLTGPPDSGGDAGGSYDTSPPVTDSSVTDSSVLRDVVVDAPQDTSAGKRELYLVTYNFAPMPPPTSIEVVDLVAKRVTRDVQLSGTVTLAYDKGSLYAVRGAGQSRIAVLDPDTLGVSRNVTLPWDPNAAVFSADRSVVYVARGDAFIDRITVATGAVTGEVQVPLTGGQTGTRTALGIALSSTGRQVGVTLFNGNTSSVALVSTSGTSLSVAANIVAAAVDGGCSRSNAAIAFSPDDSHVTTFDASCGTIDSYLSADLTRDDTASAQFARPPGVGNATLVYDPMNQAWTANYDTIYRAPTANPSGRAAFTLAGIIWSGNVVMDGTGATLWAAAYDPHNNGIFSINLRTGEPTKESWDLTLIPTGVGIRSAIYVAR